MQHISKYVYTFNKTFNYGNTIDFFFFLLKINHEWKNMYNSKGTVGDDLGELM